MVAVCVQAHTYHHKTKTAIGVKLHNLFVSSQSHLPTVNFTYYLIVTTGISSQCVV